MALQSPYLAAENSAMDRRSRALYRFLVASPIFLLVVVGLVGHVKKPAHIGAAGTAAYDQKVLAFRDRVVSARAMVTHRAPYATADFLREAKRWSSGFRKGEIVAIPPAAYEDHLREGVRGEIVRAGMGIASTASVNAEQTLGTGAVASAVEQAIEAAETSHGLRGFELQAFLQSLLVQRRCMVVLGEAWPQLSATEKERLRPRLRALVIDPKEVDELADLERNQFRDYLQRQKISLSDEKENESLDESTDLEQSASRKSTTTHNARIQAILALP